MTPFIVVVMALASLHLVLYPALVECFFSRISLHKSFKTIPGIEIIRRLTKNPNEIPPPSFPSIDNKCASEPIAPVPTGETPAYENGAFRELATLNDKIAAVEYCLDNSLPDPADLAEKYGPTFHKLVMRYRKCATVTELMGVYIRLEEEKILLLKLQVQKTDTRNQQDAERLSFPAPIDFEYNISNWNVHKVYRTEQLELLMKNYGVFPSQVFVRDEMKILWSILCEGIINKGKKFAVVGSPGVGKSTIVVLLSLYFTIVEKRNVFLVRKLKEGADEVGGLCALCLRSDGHHTGYSSVKNIINLGNIYEQFKSDIQSRSGSADKKCLIVLDGWRLDDLAAAEPLAIDVFSKFHLLATSDQYSPKDDEPQRPVLLPAWQKADLALYEKLVEKVKKSATVDTRYYYSGGNLRNFIAGKGDQVEELKNKVDESTSKIQSDTLSAIVSKTGMRRGAGLDRLQRAYAIDRMNSSHYTAASKWYYVLDSRYVREQLFLILSLESIKSSMEIAKLSGVGSWYGWTFETYLHKLAYLKTGTIRMRPYNKKTSAEEVINLNEIDSFQCHGRSLPQSCIEFLQGNAKPGLYWCPNYENYPAVDAVLFLPSSKRVVYLQTTISEGHSFNQNVVKKTHDPIILAAHEFLQASKDTGAGWTYSYVVLLPSVELAETFRNSGKSAVTKQIAELEGNVYVGFIVEDKGLQNANMRSLPMTQEKKEATK